MTCRALEKRISRYVDGLLPEGEAAAVDRHLAGCSKCQAEIQSLRTALDTLVLLPAVQERPGGWERLVDRLEAPRETPAPARTFPALWWTQRLAAAGVAACLVGAVALVMWQGRSGQGVSHSTAAITGQHQDARVAENTPTAPGNRSTVAHPTGLANVNAPQAAPALQPNVGRSEQQAPRPAEMASAPRSYTPRDQLRATPKQSRVRAAAPAAMAVVASAQEPDPESGQQPASYSTGSVAKDTANMVSTGLQPLVTAAQSTDKEDPLNWLSDVSTEDWL